MTFIYYTSLSMFSNSRLCRDLVPAKGAINLFSIIGIQNERASWITALLDVTISRDDSLSLWICLKCKLQNVSLKKSVAV